MKHVSVIVAAAAALAAFPALAQDVTVPSGVFVDAQTENEYLAKDHLIGAKIYGPDGKIIADIEDLIVNDSNQVIGVVIGAGGYFGIAEKKIGVNLGALKFEEKDGKMAVTIPDVSADTLNAAPDFKRSKPPKSLFDRAKEKVHELSDKTSTTAAPAIESATEKAKEAYDKAKEAATPVIEKATDAAGEALSTAKEAAQGAVEGAAKALAPEEAPPAAAPEAPPAETTTEPATPPTEVPAETPPAP